MPGRAAVLVDHDREVVPLPPHLGERDEHPLAGRQPLDLAGQVADRGAPVVVRPDQQVAQVHEADDVVVGAVDHRVPGVRLRAYQLGGLARE